MPISTFTNIYLGKNTGIFNMSLIGTKDIITMYHVALSERFDIEGMSTSKELTLKRKQGGIKR